MHFGSRLRSTSTAALGAAALLVAGCSDSTGVDNTATLDVLLTDAPSDYVGEAMVDIGAVELLGGAGGPIVLTEDGTEGMVDLLTLQESATMLLASAEFEAGSFSQLRLVVEAASVTLAEPYTFTDGTTTRSLTVPSGAQSGLKLNLSAGDAEGTSGQVEIAPGHTVLVLDFDVLQSFRLQGNPETSAGLSDVSFQPTLRVVVDDVAGSISGTVATETEATVAGLPVTAEPVDGTILEPFQTTTAMTATGEDGAYTVYFLVPGDYEMSVDAGEGWTAMPLFTGPVSVGLGEDVFEIDFDVVAAGG